MKYILITFQLLVLNIIMISNVSNAQLSSPLFSEYLILNTIAPGLYDVQVSEGGRYIIVYADVFSSLTTETDPVGIPIYQSTAIQIWDTNNWVTNAGEMLISPTETLTFETMESYVNNNFNRFSISPNEEFLAIHAGNEILIYTLPNLQSVYNTFVSELSDIRWSIDSIFLSWVEENTLKSLNIQTGNLTQIRFEQEINLYFFRTDSGLILTTSLDEESSFIHCNHDLICQNYIQNAGERTNIISDSTGEIVWIISEDAIFVWEFQDEQIYTLTNTIITDNFWCGAYVNPTNMYLVSLCEDTILSLTDLSPIYTLSFYQRPIWFEESDSFLLMDIPDAQMSINLFELGNDDPLDTLFIDFQSIANGIQLLENNALTISLSGLGEIYIYNQDFAVVDLDWGIIFIPFIQ